MITERGIHDIGHAGHGITKAVELGIKRKENLKVVIGYWW